MGTETTRHFRRSLDVCRPLVPERVPKWRHKIAGAGLPGLGYSVAAPTIR